MANWYNMLKDEMDSLNDDFGDKTCTLTDDELKVEFDNSYGREEGAGFTAWGNKYVYFPLCYDGSEWIGFAPRSPCDISMKHQGG
jgi:hypothetical protein